MVFGTIERKNYPRDWVMKAEDLWFMFGGKGGVISDTGIYDTGTNFLSKALDHMAWRYKDNCIEYLKLELT